MTILIKGGRILDPATKTDDVMDLFIEDGVITKRGKNIKKKAEKTIDAKGLYVMPGLVDMHVHLRDQDLLIRGMLKQKPVPQQEADIPRYLQCQIPSRW